MPEDLDLAKPRRVENRLSMCVDNCKDFLWLEGEESIQRVEGGSKSTDKILEVDLMDVLLLRTMRDFQEKKGV